VSTKTRIAAAVATGLVGMASWASASAQAAGDVPAHVKNFMFWKQSGIATHVPATWAAANVTFAETGSPVNAAAFKAAGGKYAIIYSDPNYYYVAPDYRSHGDFPESAYAHDPSGSRISRPQGKGLEYYLLPNSAQAVETYRQVTERDIAGGIYDFVFADGVSDSLGTSLYRMSAQPVEIGNDSDYVRGMKRMLAAAARPAIVNGFNNGNPIAIETYVTAPNVAGLYGETCFHRNDGPRADQVWHNDAQALLYTTAHARFAFCGGHGNDADNRAERVYWLASWWLTYDPQYSVAVEVFESPGDIYAFPEMQLVPTDPVKSAGTDIDRLRASGGAYVREFRACYDRRTPIGACAAVVNPSSSSSAPVGTLALHYSRTLELDQNNLYDGGRILWVYGVPTSLGPSQAAVIAH